MVCSNSGLEKGKLCKDYKETCSNMRHVQVEFQQSFSELELIGEDHFLEKRNYYSVLKPFPFFNSFGFYLQVR